MANTAGQDQIDGAAAAFLVGKGVLKYILRSICGAHREAEFFQAGNDPLCIRAFTAPGGYGHANGHGLAVGKGEIA